MSNKEDTAIKDSVEAIKILREVLSAMIQYPIYESDQTIIGKKNFVRYEQVPILVDSKRELVEDKLLELISEL